jgi:iron complex outermembrane receptor protein
MKATNRATKFFPAILLAAVAAIPNRASAASLMEEIIVTATKREESSQDVPISISAFSGETMDTLGFNVAMDVASQVPNLQFKSEFAFTSPTIFLRGIGNESFFANSIQPVGMYADGVYIGQSIVQGFQLFDLERVEVLRGPQGTLFGRNTTGGLINFIARKPDVDDGFNGRLELTGGDYGQFDVNAAFGFPLSDNAAARLAVFRQSLDGFFTNVNPAFRGDEGEIEAVSFRGELSWQPNDRLDILLNIHGGDSDSQMRGYKPAYTACPPGVPVGEFQGGCTGPFGLGLSDVPGFRDLQLSLPTEEDVETIGGTIRIEWQAGDYTITSLTGIDTAEMTRFEDDDGNVLSILSDTFLADTDFWSQELRITSNYTGPFNWMLGFNYYSDELDTLVHFNDRDIPIPLFNGTGLAQELTQETDSWAVFGDVTWDFAHRWRLSLGLRLTEDEREADVLTYVTNTGAVPAMFIPVVPATEPASYDITRAATLVGLIPPTNVAEDWFEWSGRAALSYELDENQLVYASASRGFKGGEFNGGALSQVESVVITDPEFVDSYEIGYKGTLFDSRMQLNISGFYMDIKDQQLQINNPTPGGVIPLLANAGKAESKGVEVEVRLQPNEVWFFSLGGAYLDADYEEFFDPGAGIDRSGNELGEAPEWTFKGLARFEQPIANGLFSIQADWSWNDDRFFTAENDPALTEDAYALVNLRGAYRFQAFNDKSIELVLFVRNVFDEDYLVGGFDAQSIADNNIFIPGDPRTFGGQVIFEFE